MLNDRDAKADSAVEKQGKMSEKLSVAVLTPKKKRNRLTAAECLVPSGVESMFVFLFFVLS